MVSSLIWEALSTCLQLSQRNFFQLFSGVFVVVVVVVVVFRFSLTYWGLGGAGRSLSTEVLTVSSANPGPCPGGPEGGWARRACSRRLRGALGSCMVWPG